MKFLINHDIQWQVGASDYQERNVNRSVEANSEEEAVEKLKFNYQSITSKEFIDITIHSIIKQNKYGTQTEI
jgi:ribosomal protein L20A (L18A)